MNDKACRENLVELLRGGHAHAAAKQALANVAPELRNVRPAAGVHSVWEELEHLRLAQEDILRYTLDASWQSPPWPEGYWPATTENLTDEAWQTSVQGFFDNLEELIQLAQDAGVDLTAAIPHGGGGHTYLREIMLAADHNAYHLGQIVQTRKLLGDWPT